MILMICSVTLQNALRLIGIIGYIGYNWFADLSSHGINLDSLHSQYALG